MMLTTVKNSITRGAVVTGKGLVSMDALFAAIVPIWLLFVGIPAYLFGESGAVFGVGTLTILAWCYIMGMFIHD